MSHSDCIESEEYKGYTINIVQDDDPINPRENDNLGTMVCFHRRYNLGDDKELFDDPRDLADYIRDNKNKIVALPLYLIDHSGIAMRTHSFSDVDPGEWDSGMVGYIFVTYEKLREEYSQKRMTKKFLARIKGYLCNEVQEYSDYLEGNAFGYQIVDSSGEQIDSCYGYYPNHQRGEYYKYALDDAHAHIDYVIREKEKQIAANDTQLEQVKEFWGM